MFEAILFDFDGTVIDTNELIILSYKHAFKTVLDYDISIEEIIGLFGRPLLISLQEDYGMENGEKLYWAFREFNESRHDEIAKPFNGIPDAVYELKNKGYKMGIVTSKRMEMLKRGLKLLKLENVFDVLIAAEDTKEHKPAPEPLICACERLGVNPCNALYVGDSIFDILCAKNAGLKSCGVKYSLTEIEKLYDAGMNMLAIDIPHLLTVLDHE